MRIRRILPAHPFLLTGLLGTGVCALWLALGLDPRDGGVGQVTFYVWRVLAAPVHLATNALAPLTDSWPDPLDGGVAVVVGLVPYVAADACWRRLRREARRRRVGARVP